MNPDQIRDLHINEVVALLDCMRATGRNAEIDWVNRTIRVVSPLMTDETVMLSDGPMRYRDIYFDISG